MVEIKKNSKVLNVTEGPMLKKMILFAIPIMLSNILQQAFNTADSIVVGRYASSNALGGVSATSPLITLIISLFTGLTVGATVAISQAIGAKDEEGASRHAHNAIATAIMGGVIVAVIGNVFAGPVLKMMGTPAEIIGYSIKYMRIYFAGAPFLLLYNYGSAILRSVGDVKKPFLYLAIAGVINVILNLILVLGFNMDSAGVAIATVVSNAVASTLVLFRLIHSTHCCHIDIKRIRIYINEFKKIIVLGLPSGIQTSLFSGSNVLMQSSINSFGAAVVAGNGASAAVEAYVSFISAGFGQAAMTFAGQNVGAKKFERLKIVLMQAISCAVLLDFFVAILIVPAREDIIRIFIPGDIDAIKAGAYRLMLIAGFHFIASHMTITSNCISGMGKSIRSMIVAVFGVCIFRIICLATVFAKYHTINVLYAIYPVSWAITACMHIIMFTYLYKKAVKTRTI